MMLDDTLMLMIRIKTFIQTGIKLEMSMQFHFFSLSQLFLTLMLPI